MAARFLGRGKRKPSGHDAASLDPPALYGCQAAPDAELFVLERPGEALGGHGAERAHRLEVARALAALRVENLRILDARARSQRVPPRLGRREKHPKNGKGRGKQCRGFPQEDESRDAKSHGLWSCLAQTSRELADLN
jgi:hypothetical protein